MNKGRGGYQLLLVVLIPCILIFMLFVTEWILCFYSGKIINQELKRAVTIGVTEGLVDELQKDRYSASDLDNVIRDTVDDYLMNKGIKNGKLYQLETFELQQINQQSFRAKGVVLRSSFFFAQVLGDFKWHIPFNVKCKIQRLD